MALPAFFACLYSEADRAARAIVIKAMIATSTRFTGCPFRLFGFTLSERPPPAWGSGLSVRIL
jgi:hypothetical protein